MRRKGNERPRRHRVPPAPPYDEGRRHQEKDKRLAGPPFKLEPQRIRERDQRGADRPIVRPVSCISAEKRQGQEKRGDEEAEIHPVRPGMEQEGERDEEARGNGGVVPGERLYPDHPVLECIGERAEQHPVVRIERRLARIAAIQFLIEGHAVADAQCHVVIALEIRADDVIRGEDEAGPVAMGSIVRHDDASEVKQGD